MLAFLTTCLITFVPPTAPPAATEAHVEALELYVEEVLLPEAIHERFHCLEDLNGPYRAPAPARTSVSTSAPAPAQGAGSDVIDWAPYVAGYPWNAGQALRVIWCESRYDRLAVNPSSGASGGWQFIPRWHNQVDPFDPADATRFAFVLWSDRGLNTFSTHWYPSEHCWATEDDS